MAAQRPAAKKDRGNDGWASDETDFNKAGSYVIMGPALICALLNWGTFGVKVDAGILYVIVAVCGIIGGLMNIHGRGPMIAGAIVGIVIALGGFSAQLWWLKGRESVFIVEATIAFVVGSLPGYGLQILLQQLLKKRTRSAQ